MSNASFYNCPCGARRTFANPKALGRWRRLHNKFCDAVGNDQQTEKEFVQGLKKSAKKAAKQARQNTTRGGRNWRDGVNRAPNGDLIMTDQVDIVAINTETGRNEIVQRIERPMNAPRSQDFSAATVMNSPLTPDLASYTEETHAQALAEVPQADRDQQELVKAWCEIETLADEVETLKDENETLKDEIKALKEDQDQE